MLIKVVIAAGVLSLPDVCPDHESILHSITVLQTKEWTRTSRLEIKNLWPQTLELEGACSSCVPLSNFGAFAESCAAASFVFTPKDGRSLSTLKIMVPAPSGEKAHDFAEKALRIIGPPADSLVVSEADPWSRSYTWSSPEDCGPNPKGCIVSMLEIEYEQSPDESFWTLTVDWTRSPSN